MKVTQEEWIHRPPADFLIIYGKDRNSKRDLFKTLLAYMRRCWIHVPVSSNLIYFA